MDIKEEAPACSRDDIIEEEPEEEDEGVFQERCEDTGLIPQIDKPMSMPYLCCKLWRWKELQVDAALHRLDPLPWCRFGRVTLNNTTVSCCNPFHYALWIFAEADSNDEQNTTGYLNGGVIGADHTMETADTGFGDECTVTVSSMINANNVGSSTHNPIGPMDSSISNLSTGRTHPRNAAWALMYRWQEKTRMDERGVMLCGEFVAVGLLANAVHDGQNVCCEWDLQNEVSFALIRQPLKEDQSCEEVWLYNSGKKPLFFSTSSSLKSQRTEPPIRRVTPGYCYKVHKFGGATSTRIETKSSATNSMCFLNISVGKGWGTNYHRNYLTDTPCRYEVIFAPNIVMSQ